MFFPSHFGGFARKVAKIAPIWFALFVSPYQTTPELIRGFSWNLMLGSFTKVVAKSDC
jgi:hypothetical protein